MNAILWIRAGVLFGFLAVALGSFGAHWLTTYLHSPSGSPPAETRTTDESSRPPLTPERRLEVFETGVRYHMFHALALLAVGLWAAHAGGLNAWTSLAAWAFTAGIVLFSGSLYLLGYTGLRWLGAITPLGGVAFLIGWAAFFVSLA
jgi:uncharacterized membrane protein YgdD (TMEM256/DUF423 family)